MFKTSVMWQLFFENALRWPKKKSFSVFKLPSRSESTPVAGFISYFLETTKINEDAESVENSDNPH